VLQQTPSTQLPEPHSVPAAQVEPFALLQLPLPSALQTRPVPQLAVLQHAPSTQ
jgi:hypothetical protein